MRQSLDGMHKTFIKKKKFKKNLYINIAYVKVSKLTFRDGNWSELQN